MDEDSEIDVFISFQTILSGYVRIELYDPDNRIIANSYGGENWNMLKAAVPKGKYFLRIVGVKTVEDKCWSLGFSFSYKKAEVCYG